MEEQNDVAAEITLAEFDGVEDTSKTESSPVKEAEVTTEADKTPEAEPKEEAQAEPENKETEGEETPAEETDKPLAKADERKAQLNTEIRDLVSQRNALRDEVAKANAEVYQPATENELVDQGMSTVEAKVEAMRQEREVEKYNERVAEAQLTIGHESERVLQDFPMFNPDSPNYDQELGQEAATLLEANLIYDQNTGQVIGSNVSPYQLYKTLARAAGLSTVKGQLKGQKDTEQMLANADTASSAAPPAKAKDPTGLDALWAPDAKF